jgi:hypothetical protein
MRLMCRWITAMALAIAPAAFADQTKTNAPSLTEIPIPAPYANEVSLAMQWGRALWLNDQASAAATDVLRDKGLLAGHGKATGWITTPYDEKLPQWRVFFTEDDHGTPKDFVDMVFDVADGKARLIALQPHVPSVTLTTEEQAMVSARDQALKEPVQRCTTTYNQAVWLVHHPKGWYTMVDLLPARTEVDVYPVGGFHTFNYGVLDKDTPRHFQQTNACLTKASPAGVEVTSIVVQHRTSPTPTKFHAFMSLSYGKQLLVVTTSNHLLWRVDHGSIRLLDTTTGPAHDLLSTFPD